MSNLFKTVTIMFWMIATYDLISQDSFSLYLAPRMMGFIYFFVIALSAMFVYRFLKMSKTTASEQDQNNILNHSSHTKIVVDFFESALLLLPALMILVLTPRSLDGQAAQLKGGMTFTDNRSNEKPDDLENQSSDQYIKTNVLRIFNLYNQRPASVLGKKVTIEGIIFHEKKYTPSTALIRFVMYCCAADALPIGVLLEIPSHLEPTDNTWVTIKGTINSHYSVAGADKQIPIIKVEDIRETQRPKNPYLSPF